MSTIIQLDEDAITAALLREMERGIDWNFQKWMAENLDIPANNNSPLNA